MSLSQALSSAISGLRANQAGLALIAGNVANADTPGYIRKTVNQVATASNGTYVGVSVESVQRELDTYVQKQLRVENSGASYADTRAQFFQQLQDIFGQPGSSSSLEGVYNDFTGAVQALSTSPDDPTARSGVIGAAQALAQQLNQMSDSIQSLRSQAELGISDAVNQANDAMSQIASLNQRISASGQNDSSTATLEDQRDAYIDQLSQLMDINVVQSGNNQVSIFTNFGVQLVGTQASQLSFDAKGTITPSSQWTADPSTRGVGTLTLTSPNGGSIDLIQSKALRSGTIAADLQMRDQDLVQAQNQLDALAAGMASALSDTTTPGGVATTPPPPTGVNGFDVDIGSLQAGNTITVNYTDSVTNTPHTLTFVRVDDPSALPLPDSATANPNDKVVGLDFSGGMSSVLAQINSALSSTGMTASTTGGTTLRVLDDGAGNRVDVNSVSTTTTATSLNGGVGMPFFTDGTQPYTGAITGQGSESVGLAGRIAVNSDLVDDPSKLVLYQSGTETGDNTRPNFIYQQLTNASVQFAGNTGIGAGGAPFSGSISTYLRQVISQQSQAANSASSLQQGQDVVLSSLQQRFSQASGVSVDQEMANLLTLQNAYAANARVMSTVTDLFNTLMQM